MREDLIKDLLPTHGEAVDPHEMARRDAKKGLVTLCIGGGMGVAMCVER
mgnify:CR=1 FL=1